MQGNSPRTLIVGLGRTGVSVAKFFQKRSVSFAAADSRQSPPGYKDLIDLCPGTEVRLGDFDESFFLESRELVVSPGVSLKSPAIQTALARGIPVVGDVELFARELAGGRSRCRQVIAITGSNGKSTVTALVSDMATRSGMKVAVGGNYLTPALDLIDTDTDCYVLELSSFQLETTRSLRPAVSTVLNISEDHLDRHDSFEHYVKAKQRVHRGSATVVLNREERVQHDPGRAARVVSFGLDAPHEDSHFGVVTADGRRSIACGSELWIDCSDLGYLPGDSGVLNAQAALALGSAVGMAKQGMLEALRRFAGLSHRFEILGTCGEVSWINDSKATNVAAAVTALASVKSPCVWIAGGDGKGMDFSPLREAAGRCVRAAFLFGRDASRIASVVTGAVAEVRIVSGLDEAARQAHAVSRSGDCVLLSPACASTDLFSDYQERGARFVDIFREIGGQ